MILFDTSVLSLVFRRSQPDPKTKTIKQACQDLIDTDIPLGLPGIVLQEILSGIRSESQFETLEQLLLGAFSIIPARVDEHLAAAQLKNQCLASGLNVSGIDCLIAATALTGKHQLFTVDSDFEQIARIAPLKFYTA